MGMQSLLAALYPPRCLACAEPVTQAHALCGRCWREASFISGAACDQCGVPLAADGVRHPLAPELCDDCLRLARPWTRGRAALLYAGTGRRVVLALKHGDRLDLARPAARWMVHAGADLLQGDPLLVPVPLHWTRLLRRRFNQSAVLSGAVARLTGLSACPDALQRRRLTPTQDGRSPMARFENLQDAIRAHPRNGARITGRRVVLIDDVMTSGATLAVAADACLAAGAADVDVLVLARVAKSA